MSPTTNKIPKNGHAEKHLKLTLSCSVSCTCHLSLVPTFLMRLAVDMSAILPADTSSRPIRIVDDGSCGCSSLNCLECLLPRFFSCPTVSFDTQSVRESRFVVRSALRRDSGLRGSPGDFRVIISDPATASAPPFGHNTEYSCSSHI